MLTLPVAKVFVTEFGMPWRSDWWFSGASYYDDVIKWKHFPRNWPFVRGIHRSPVNSPHKGQGRGALMFSLICVWINGWVNNREAGDLRRYRAHYDVTVMSWPVWPTTAARWQWMQIVENSFGMPIHDPHNFGIKHCCLWTHFVMYEMVPVVEIWV